MSMSFLLLALFYLLLSGLFSGVETGSYMINRIRLRHRVRKRRRSALLLSQLLSDSHIFIFSVLIGNNLVIYLLSYEVTNCYLETGMMSRMLWGVIPWNAEVAATVTLMFPIFIFAEMGPKNLFHVKADVLMYRLAGVLRIMVWIFYPFTWTLKKLFTGMTRGQNEEPGRELHRLSPDGLKEYFSAGAEEGVLSGQQSRMMDNATSMHSVPVRRIMTPLKEIPSLPISATGADFRRLAARRGCLHALLIKKHSVVGMVSLFTVVHRALPDDAPLDGCYTEVPHLRDNRNLKSAFYRLRRTPLHSVVITDARNHPVGFLRLEDIARYIADNH